MTKEELKKLKEQIKHEIINEITRKDFVKDNTWRTLKKEFTQMFHSKGYKDTYEVAIMFSGIQTVLRTSLGYRSVELIPADKYDEAKKVMFTLFNLYPNKNEQ